MLFESADDRVASRFIKSSLALLGDMFNKMDDAPDCCLMLFLRAVFSIFGW